MYMCTSTIVNRRLYVYSFMEMSLSLSLVRSICMHNIYIYRCRYTCTCVHDRSASSEAYTLGICLCGCNQHLDAWLLLSSPPQTAHLDFVVYIRPWWRPKRVANKCSTAP